ncbi:MAG TPA: hypothetical protein V6C76_06050 [Drouetiella sp.]
MNAKSILPFLVVATCIPLSMPAFADTTSDVMHPESLKKLGAKKLTMRFEESKNDTMPQKTWLQGSNAAGSVLWKKSVPLKENVNTAKTDVICRNGRIEVISQFPGSAAYTKQTFLWNGNVVSFVSKINADPCQEQVEKLKKLATSGTMQQLESFENQEHVIFYPANYINIDNVKALLTDGHKVAAKLFAAHKPALAAQRMKVCFEASKVLCYLEEQNGNNQGEPDAWIEAWSEDQVSLPSNFWKPLLADYASFLKESGQAKRASGVMDRISKI